MSQAAARVWRGLSSCACAPRKRFTIYLLLVIFSVVALLFCSTVTVQLPREEQMENRISDLHSHLQFLEALYRSRQEDVMLMQNTVVTKDGMEGMSTLSPELQVLLKNISGTKAATGIFPKSVPTLRLPFVRQLLPHLMNDVNSLRPAYHLKSDRDFAQVVIGIPTVKRDKESYLMITLHHLICGLTIEADLKSTLIVVMIGETDLEYVINVARQIENRFTKEVDIGLIEIISPSPSYYPDFNTLPVTLGDSLKRVKWRTKQNLDTVYLMAYVQAKGTFYLMLEDDVIAKLNYMQEINQFTAATSVSNPDWFFIEYCQIGGIGKLFKSSNLPNFIVYVQLFYSNMPVDWLLESYLADRVCSIEKNSRTCQQSKLDIRPRYKASLFQHIGLYSSLKGKIQKIKDLHFGAVPTFYPHQNPPVESVRTTLEEHQDHTLKRAYEGTSFFWGLKPRNGDVVEFWFEKPTSLEKYVFRSGNVEHVSDKFYSTAVEVLQIDKTNFTVVGAFDEFGMAENTLATDLGPLTAIRLKVNQDSNYWAILSEIELKTKESSR